MKTNRTELIERAAELKVKTIKLHTPNANTNYETWKKFFSRPRDWSNKALKDFIKVEEERHARYLMILTEK